MAVIKCKMCGGDLAWEEGASTAACEYCGTLQTVPKVDDEKKLTLFARANRLRIGCEFDKAAGIYESIVADFPEEAEAYWGLVLCKYGIEYVDDPATGKKIPTCHRSGFDSVMEDNDFEQALENADAVARRVYREEAKQIEEIRRGIIAVSSREQPYDIFICYKETDEKGERTLDSVLAQDLYDALTGKGYRVFFARITLEDKLGMEYEPYIFAALNSARIMLAVGTDYEYYNAVWVKNEWSRYLKLMAKDKDKHLIPCYKGIDAYDMPREFARLQAQDLGKVGATQDLLRGIAKIIGGTLQAPVAAPAAMGALTKRGYLYLEDGDFKGADGYFDRALDENPEDGKAYIGKVLAECGAKELSQLENHSRKLNESKNFKWALRFAVGAEKAQLEAIAEKALKTQLIGKLISSLKGIAREKEIKEVWNMIGEYAATATVEGYEKIVQLCIRQQQLHTGTVSAAKYNSYKRQLDIMRLLSAADKTLTLDEIRRSPYFGGVIIAEVLAEDIKTMLAQGSVERGAKFGTYCVKGSAQRIEMARKEADYARATELLAAGSGNGSVDNCIAAEKLFASLGDFRDAPEQVIKSKNMAQWVKQEQKRQMAIRWQNAGQCRHCGGTFKGMFTKKCSFCGKMKDY